MLKCWNLEATNRNVEMLKCWGIMCATVAIFKIPGLRLSIFRDFKVENVQGFKVDGCQHFNIPRLKSSTFQGWQHWKKFNLEILKKLNLENVEILKSWNRYSFLFVTQQHVFFVFKFSIFQDFLKSWSLENIEILKILKSDTLNPKP